MKLIDYNLPIFKEKEKADLNLYSEKMAEALKVQIDKFGNPLIFKGTVESLEQLDLLICENGSIYRVIEENKNYVFNGESWLEYSDNINIDILEKKTHKYSTTISTTSTAGTEIELPCYYEVGSNVIDVYFNGERLLLSSDETGTDGHYQEVGTSGEISNKIKSTTDWYFEAGDVLDLEVRGEYNET